MVIKKGLSTHELQFMYQCVLDNHPGIYNKLDPDFKVRLDQSYYENYPLLEKAITLEENQSIIASFAAHFEDGHVGAGMVWAQYKYVTKAYYSPFFYPMPCT